MRLLFIALGIFCLMPLSFADTTTLAKATPGIQSCNFSQFSTMFETLLTEEQKNYELDVELFERLVGKNNPNFEKNQIKDHWGVNKKLISIGKIIYDQNYAFDRFVKGEVIPDLTCECIFTKTKDDIEKMNHLSPESRVHLIQMCQQRKRVEKTIESQGLPVTDTIRSNLECPATYSGQVLVSSGDSSNYMRTCFYCPEGAQFYNPFNSTSNIAITSCISTVKVQDTTFSDRADLYGSLLTNGGSQEANRLLLVEVEKAYGSILKKYQQRVQTIRNAFEDAYNFAKNAYAKDPCNDCFKYAAHYRKNLVVDPFLPSSKWTFIVNFNNGYDENLGQYLGPLGGGFGGADLRITNLNLGSTFLTKKYTDEELSVISDYYIQEHYIKPKGQSAAAFESSEDANKYSPMAAIKNVSLSKYGAKYPFQEMLDYLKKLYGATEALNTMAYDHAESNKKLVKQSSTALKTQVALQAANAPSKSTLAVLNNLQKTVEKSLEEAAVVEETVAKLGVVDQEISKDSLLKINMIIPYMELSKGSAGTVSINASLDPKLITSSILHSGMTLSPSQLSSVSQEVSYSLGRKNSRSNIFAGSISTRLQGIKKAVSDLENVDKATIEKQSFKEFKNKHKSLK